MEEQRFQKLLRGNFGEAIGSLNHFEDLALSITEEHFRGTDYLRFPEIYRSVEAEDVRRFIAENLTRERSALSLIVPKKGA